MRIVHVADLHQGLLTHSWPDPATGIPSRLLDVARCWHAACEQAVLRQADTVIVAGDVFHTRNPDALALKLFDDGLRLLEAERIPAVIIPGNHDGATHPGQPSVLEVFRSDLVRVATKPEVVHAGDVAVACLPWVTRAQLLSSYPGISRAEAVQRQVEGLERILDDLRAKGADVLTGHWSVQGAVLGSEADIAIVGEGEAVLPQASLEGPWPYAAFGHIHGSQTGAVGNTLWAYSGSVDRMNFGEENDDKSAWDILIADGGVKSIVKIGLPARRFVTIDGANLANDELAALAGGVDGAIVRVRVRMHEDHAHQLDRGRLDSELRADGAAQVLIQVDVERSTRARAERVTSSLGLEESIAEWFEAAGVDETDRPALRDMAKQLVEEVS